MKIIPFFIRKKKIKSTFVHDFNSKTKQDETTKNKNKHIENEIEIIPPEMCNVKSSEALNNNIKLEQKPKKQIFKIFRKFNKKNETVSVQQKKEKKFVHVICNLVIVCMLVIMAGLTLNFNSQYVFGYKNSEAIYNGNKNSNNVSLMINVYWGTEFLDDMLQTLDDYEIKCTFFVGGQWVEKEPEMLKKIYNKGHEIGNHGYFHRDHDKLSYDQNKEEISVNHNLVKETIGVEMNLFAPPSGAYNKTTLDVASTLGYKTILWSKDTIDWRDKNADLIFQRATNKVCGGDLILMHPTKETSVALPKILENYKTKGITATTVTNNLKG